MDRELLGDNPLSFRAGSDRVPLSALGKDGEIPSWTRRCVELLPYLFLR